MEFKSIPEILTMTLGWLPFCHRAVLRGVSRDWQYLCETMQATPPELLVFFGRVVRSGLNRDLVLWVLRRQEVLPPNALYTDMPLDHFLLVLPRVARWSARMDENHRNDQGYITETDFRFYRGTIIRNFLRLIPGEKFHNSSELVDMFSYLCPGSRTETLARLMLSERIRPWLDKIVDRYGIDGYYLCSRIVFPSNQGVLTIHPECFRWLVRRFHDHLWHTTAIIYTELGMIYGQLFTEEMHHLEPERDWTIYRDLDMTSLIISRYMISGRHYEALRTFMNYPGDLNDLRERLQTQPLV